MLVCWLGATVPAIGRTLLCEGGIGVLVSCVTSGLQMGVDVMGGRVQQLKALNDGGGRLLRLSTIIGDVPI